MCVETVVGVKLLPDFECFWVCIHSGIGHFIMWIELFHSRRLTGFLTVAAVMGWVLLIFLTAFNINPVQAQEDAEATANSTVATPEPEATPFSNLLTQLAAPTATDGPEPSATPTGVNSTGSVTASPLTLNAVDAMATITAQQDQITALQNELAAAQGDNGATLYAVIIIIVGFLLAFGVFFGLRRG